MQVPAKLVPARIQQDGAMERAGIRCSAAIRVCRFLLACLGLSSCLGIAVARAQNSDGTIEGARVDQVAGVVERHQDAALSGGVITVHYEDSQRSHNGQLYTDNKNTYSFSVKDVRVLWGPEIPEGDNAGGLWRVQVGSGDENVKPISDHFYTYMACAGKCTPAYEGDIPETSVTVFFNNKEDGDKFRAIFQPASNSCLFGSLQQYKTERIHDNENLWSPVGTGGSSGGAAILYRVADLVHGPTLRGGQGISFGIQTSGNQPLRVAFDVTLTSNTGAKMDYHLGTTITNPAGEVNFGLNGLLSREPFAPGQCIVAPVDIHNIVAAPVASNGVPSGAYSGAAGGTAPATRPSAQETRRVQQEERRAQQEALRAQKAAQAVELAAAQDAIGRRQQALATARAQLDADIFRHEQEGDALHRQRAQIDSLAAQGGVGRSDYAALVTDYNLKLAQRKAEIARLQVVERSVQQEAMDIQAAQGELDTRTRQIRGRPN
jgi:hypothetical protein